MSVRVFFWMLGCWLVLLVGGRADDLPAGYELGEDTVSPDGRFGVLYPLGETVLAKGEYPPNLLVQLRPYVELAKVGSLGLPLSATTSLDAQWSGNDLLAVLESRKWGLLRLWVYEFADGKVKRVHPIGEEARKIFVKDLKERFLKKYPKEDDYFAWVEREDDPDFKFAGRKVQLHLSADNKPNLAAGPHWTAELRAVWNLGTGKFEKVDFRPGKITVRKGPEE